MDARTRAVAFDAAIRSRAGHILASRLFDQRFVERFTMPAVVFAEVDTDHLGAAGERHDGLSVSLTGVSSRCEYLMTSTFDSTTSPSSIISSRTGRYARILDSSSTTDSRIGWSRERLSRFSLWNRRWAP